MSAFDRYVLTRALLDGDAAVRLVLADLLSDDGEHDLADFARRARRGREGDLDLAVRLLPCPKAIDLGCDFIEHVADVAQAALRSHLARVRRLFRFVAMREQLEAASTALTNYRTVRNAWYDEPLTLLDDAIHSLVDAIAAAAQWEQPIVAASVPAIGVAVASAARSVRDFQSLRHRVKKRSKELEWQIRRTKQILGELVRPARAERV